MASPEVPERWLALGRYAIEKGLDFWSMEHFTVHIHWKNHIEGNGEDDRTTGGHIHLDGDYLEATISVNWPSIDDDVEVYRILTHEVAHLALIGYQSVERFVLAQAHDSDTLPLATHLSMMVTQAKEQTVVRLERAFRGHYPLERALVEIETKESDAH